MNSVGDLPPVAALAQLMYTDGLHSIFQFLSLAELLPAVAACRSWRDAAYKEPSRGVCCELAPSLLPLLLFSPLRHHVSSYASWDDFPLSLVLPLTRHLPRLADLSLSFEPWTFEPLLPESGADAESYDSSSAHTAAVKLAASQLALTFPRDGVLRRLSLRMRFVSDAEANGWEPRILSSALQRQSVQMLLELASALPAPSSITDLTIAGAVAGENQVDLSSLARLTNLARLTFNEHLRLGQAQIELLKQTLPSLRYLDIHGGRWSVQQLEWLCSPPHRLQRLQEVSLQCTQLTRAHLTALAQLPALTTLSIDDERDSDALLLLHEIRFPQLRSLRFCFDCSTDAQAVLPSARAFGAQLTELELVNCDFASEKQSADFFSSLPSLQSLSLSGVGLPSLLALRSLLHLHSLALSQCTVHDSAYLQTLQHLPSLRQLSIEIDAPQSGDHDSNSDGEEEEEDAGVKQIRRMRQIAHGPLLKRIRIVNIRLRSVATSQAFFSPTAASPEFVSMSFVGQTF